MAKMYRAIIANLPFIDVVEEKEIADTPAAIAAATADGWRVSAKAVIEEGPPVFVKEPVTPK